MPFWQASRYASRLTRAERMRFWDYQCTPPNVRGRRREARRWIDLMRVLTLNPRRSHARPGEGSMSLAESRAIWAEARERLHQCDPELARAVERLEWEKRSRDVAGTLDEWKVRVMREAPRLDRLRAEMRQFGVYPLSREQIWAILKIPSREVFLSTAEVAERQTR
jgi:hypothetical protein